VYYVARSSINDASGQPSRQHYTSDGTTNERLTTTTAPFGGGNSLVLAGSRVYFVSGQGASGGSAFETGGDLFSINRTSYQVSANVNGSIGIDDSAMILGASSSRLFFSTRTSGVPTIASTDGTSVVRYTTVNDVRSSTGRGLQTPQLTSVGGRSYFVGASGLTGSGLTYSYRVNLFSVDETSGTDIRQHTANTTTMVDANTRAFYRMATVGSSLFFSMSSLGAANSKLFEVHSSGTGVRQVASLNGSSADEIRWLTTLGSKVFFRALVGGRSKLFSYDGTELVQITDLVPDGNDEPCGLTAAMGRIFFWAYTGFETSKLARLFSTDGTDLIQHTLLNSSIDDVSMSGCSTEVGPGMLAVGNDFLLFTARDGSTSRMKLFSICSADNPNCGAN
jgi:hypothetical protein